MTRSRRFVVGALAAAGVLGLGLSAAALARGPGGHDCASKHGHRSEHRLERALEALELDAQTRAAVERTLDTRRETRRALRGEVWDARRELWTLLDQDTPDAEAVLTQAEVLGELHTESRKERLRTQLEIQALLSPAARAELRELLRPRRTFQPKSLDR